MEKILTEVTNRFVLFPIKYQSIWNMYKKAQSAFWTAEEIDMSKDSNDWEKLTENEKHFIKNILAFFAGSDGIVNENLSVRFMNEVAPMEAKSFYGFQIAMENIHCVAANTLILTDTGYHPIFQLEDKYVNVWNGERFSKVQVRKTSDHAKVINVKMNNGLFLQATEEHKWLIEGHEERILTRDLKPGMFIKSFNYPTDFIQDNESFFSLPYEHGAECAKSDDSQYDMIKFRMNPKYSVPINFTNDVKIKWFSGLLSNAHIFIDISGSLSFEHHNREFCYLVQLMLTTMNICVSVVNDKIEMNKYNLVKLLEMGVEIKGLTNYDTLPCPMQSTKGSTEMYISEIIDNNSYCKTFCFNEPYNHTGTFNGIVTGQSETYSLLIDYYIKDSLEKEKLLNAINTIPCIAKKADWAVKWIENMDAPFSQRIVAFACVEGIFFSGAFCAIFWLKERGVLPGLCLSNEFISRDESLHTEFAVLLYSMLENKLPEDIVHGIVRDAVEIEDEFINDSISCSMLGMNQDLMSTYIKFVADRLIIQLGYNPIWNVKNPFDFMDRIGLDGKDNFFDHTRNSNYARANIGTSDKNTFTFSTEEEF